MPDTINPTQVASRVDEISRLADDPERAHGEEKRLWRDVLEAIANDTADNPSTCAAIALGTREIRFERWFA